MNKTQLLYKQKYANFEVFIEKNFSFTPQQAYKFIRVSERFPGLSSDTVTAKLGIEKLYALTYIRDQKKLTEYVEEVSENPRPLMQIKKEIKRFNPTVRTTRSKEDKEFALNNQYYSWKDEIKDFKESREAFKEKAKEFIELLKEGNMLDKANEIKELISLV